MPFPAPAIVPTIPGADPKPDAVTSWIEVLNKAPWLLCIIVAAILAIRFGETVFRLFEK